MDQRAWAGARILALLALLAAVIFKFWLFRMFPLFVLAGHLVFFRDPKRKIPEGEALVSPADGKVVEMAPVHEHRFLGEEAVKVGIFLSLFVPHVNRSPMEGTVEYLQYQPGKFLNALRKDAVKENESNWIGIRGGPRGILVRQIAGAIARRIHCDVKKGQVVNRGEKLGIICYGSRVECFFPKRFFKPTIQVGEKVKAGETILGEWRP